MFRILLKKYYQESILLWVALALVLFFFPWVRIWTVSQFELTGFAPLIEQFRAFEKFSPVPLDQFLTYHGIIGITYDEPVVLLCVLTWCIARGTDVVSGELNRGTMEMLLAQPIHRWKILTSHAIVTTVGLGLLCLLVYLGVYLGIHTNSTPVASTMKITVPWLEWNVANPFASKQMRQTPLSELVAPDEFIAATMNLFSLGFAVLGLGVLASSFDQYRWRSIGIVIGVYVLSLLLFILSKSTPSMAVFKPFTFLSAYQPAWMIQQVHKDPQRQWYWSNSQHASSWQDTIGPLGYISLLILLGIAAYAIAFLRFSKRDLPAPN
jgi:ABC-2 type transport system permease protein